MSYFIEFTYAIWIILKNISNHFVEKMFVSEPFFVPRLGHSIFWVKFDFQDSPMDYFDFQLKEILRDKLHSGENLPEKSSLPEFYNLVKDSEVEVSLTERYAYCYLLPEELMEFRVMRFKEQRPIHCDGCASMRKYNLRFDELVVEVCKMIGADCWGVYTRDANSKPVKVYFNSRLEDEESDTSDSDDSVVMDSAREELFDLGNVRKELEAVFAQGLTFCVVMGQDNFIDAYYYADGTVVEMYY